MHSISPNNHLLMLKPKKVIILIILAFILSGCAALTKSEQPAHPTNVHINQDHQVGQSFIARYDGLQGISLFLKPIQEPSGDLTLSLFEQKGSDQPIGSAAIHSSQIDAAGYHSFVFEPIPGSTGEDFFFELTFDGTGEFEVGSAPGKTYLSGAQYLDGIAQNSQSAFRLNYAPTNMFIGLFYEGFSWIGYLILAMLMLALPGWAALSWLFPPWNKLNWISKSSLSIGIGIALYPILLLWMDTLGIHSNVINALLLPVAGLILIFVKFFREKITRDSQLDQPVNNSLSAIDTGIQSTLGSSWQQRIPDFAFILVLLILIFTRFWPIRILDAPMWGDSFQHTMMAQLLVDNGGLFTSWEPYAQLQSFTYHFGFHALAANFHWMSGLSVIQSTLWMGQILNIFAIIALYPLAMMIGKNKWAGVFAVLIAGLLSSMPMVYVNWGRYTQLAGQVILPAVIFIVWRNLDSEQSSLKWYSLVWLGLAGLALTHYRVTIFIPLFYIAYFLLHIKERRSGRTIKKTFIHAGGMLLLTLPWLIRLFEGTLPRILGSQINPGASNISQVTQNLDAIGNITNYLPSFIWLLVLLAVIWGILKRSQNSLIFSLWWVLILLAANPHWLRLPGTGVLTNFAVFIAAYIPASILIGSSLAGFLDYVGNTISERTSIETDSEDITGKRRALIGSVVLFISILLIGLWFVRPRIRDVRPAEHILLTRPDLRAAEWIEEYLPADTKFLVNSFFAYGGTAVVGSDGGWWLPLTAGRLTTQPPLTYVSEAGPGQDFVEFTNGLIAMIGSRGLSDPEVMEELDSRGITHIYIGQQRGSVNGLPLLDIPTLNEDPNFLKIYQEDRVLIYEINQRSTQ